MAERFVNIHGFDGYLIGNHGSIYSKKSNRIIKGSLDKKRNRPLVNLMRDGKSHQRKVHRLVAEHFLPAPLEGQTSVRHLNDDPMDNRVENLAWGTHSDNMQDKVRNGNSGKGQKNGNASLTEDQVKEILASDESSASLASKYPVSAMHISRIRRGTRWKHLDQ